MLVEVKLRNRKVYQDYISRLNALLDQWIFDGRAKTSLAMLVFLYSRKFVKNCIYSPRTVRTASPVPSPGHPQVYVPAMSLLALI